MAVSSIRFGSGGSREVGDDLLNLEVRRVMVLTDPVVHHLPPMQTVLESLKSRVEYSVFDRVRVEPTDESFLEAAKFAREGGFDGFIAVGRVSLF